MPGLSDSLRLQKAGSAADGLPSFSLLPTGNLLQNPKEELLWGNSSLMHCVPFHLLQ